MMREYRDVHVFVFLASWKQLRTRVMHSNTLANLTRRLKVQRHKFATIYSAICCYNPDVNGNNACDLSRLWYFVADEAYDGGK